MTFTLLISSILLAVAYVAAAIWKRRSLPESVSAMVYDLGKPWQWVWTVWLWAVTMLMVPSLMEAMPRGWQFLGFLTAAHLLFTGAMPLVAGRRNTLHNILGSAAGILSQVCVAMIGPWWLMAWCTFPILPMCDRLWYMPGLPMWMIRARVFIAEAVCAVSVYGALITNLLI